MKIKIIRATVIDREVRHPGEIVDVRGLFGAALIRRGRAVEVETAAVEPAAEKAVKPRARARRAKK